ncbi:MAG: magnesium transporter [Armatimonadetes bacterium]|nr:magnesium transporter [Armatimonadota bacterium]
MTPPDVDDIVALIEAGDPALALDRLATLHPADQAEILCALDEDDATTLLSRLSRDALAQALNYMDEEDRTRFVKRLDPADLAAILDRLQDDVAADIIQELPVDSLPQVLKLMGNREDVEELLQYPEESAGGRMTPDVMALQADWTVGFTIEFLRSQQLPGEQPYYLYVVDEEERLLGVVSLRHLITANPDTKLKDIMIRDVKSVQIDADQEQVAEKMRHYNFLAMPVVDAQGRLQGMVTADDILDVQVEEATEDMYLQEGMDADESALNPLLTSVRNRTPWLLLNLVTACCAGLLVSAFESTIARVALLAAFMPIVAGHAGNTGTQAATLVVRGLALGELSLREASRIALKSVTFGALQGAISGTLTAGLAYLLSHNVWLALIVFVAMVGNLLIAALAGALIPLAFRRLNMDPALASSIWLTTFTDICGFFMLLGLGTMLLSKIVH